MMLGRKQLLIGGEWRDASDGTMMPVVNPATEEVIAEVAAATEGRSRCRRRGGARGARRARGARCPRASAAGSIWKLGERLMEQVDEVARLETLHNGKPITESRHVEIPMAAECLQYFAGWADKVQRRHDSGEGQRAGLHAARAARRGRGDRAVELSAAAGDVEGRAGAGDGQHRHPEAREPDAADGAGARAARDRRRVSAGRAERHHRKRQPPSARPSSSIPASTRSRLRATRPRARASCGPPPTR